MTTLRERFMAAITAFREPSLISDPLDYSSFGDFEARKLRYALYWAFYENDAYRDLQNFAKAYKVQYGLYRYIRGVFNPAYRLAEFWKAHLMGGQLDRAAGKSGALPIEAENEALREPIAQLWRWSNWQINKDVLTLHGAIFGDVALRVVDDVQRYKVYLQAVHPGTISELERDPFGNVKAYRFVERRDDPNGKAVKVDYTEECERDGDNVVFRTYLNGKPYDWSGQGVEWTEPYGFVPLVVVQHNNVGLEWGWSEFHPDRAKIHNSDDLASKLHDQIRKMVDAPWLFAGVSKGSSTPTTAETRLSGDAAAKRPEPGREEIPALYGPVGSTATPLVAPLDIAAASAEIKETIAEIERDYPELKVDILRASGQVSGRALRIAQAPAEDKVQQRRANYDDALVRAQQMAVAIGGYRGYFSGFGLDSYAAGLLDHSIGERPVFAPDPLDDGEIDKAFWEAANGAIKAGVPLLAYLKKKGWTDADIAALQADPEWQSKTAMQELAIVGQRAMLAASEGQGSGQSQDGGQDNAI